MEAFEWTSEREAFLFDNYGKMTQKQIGDALGCHKSSVGRRMRALGLVREVEDSGYVDGEWQRFVNRARKKYGLIKTTVAERR